jgi:hypothetical protein
MQTGIQYCTKNYTVTCFSDYKWVFGLIIGFIEPFDTTRDYTSQFTVTHTRCSQSVTVSTSCCLVAAFNGGRSPSSEFPNCPRPQLPASYSNRSQPLNPSGYHTHSPTNYSSIGWSVTLLLDFASTVIPGFSLFEIHDQDDYSPLEMYVFRNGTSYEYSTKDGSVFLRRRYVCCTVVSVRVFRAITASRSLWTLCILCHCTVLSNIYTRYTEVFWQ